MREVGDVGQRLARATGGVRQLPGAVHGTMGIMATLANEQRNVAAVRHARQMNTKRHAPGKQAA
ncbi:MAG: hypothetical protein H7Y61_13385 [Rhizobiales bacterium]|nr:hypothetical protein [Rhizobacter sp.]